MELWKVGFTIDAVPLFTRTADGKRADHEKREK